jgi:segregation and condensation protein B
MTEQNEIPLPKLEYCLEALLFVTGGPVTIPHLAETLDVKKNEVEQGLKNLIEMYHSRGSLSLQWHDGKVQLTTAPRIAPLIERFIGIEVTTRLSRAALETLAIIAYRQPTTRPSIDAIRGVSSDYILKSLLSKGLVEEVGRSETPGRPILYGTTPDFLQHFGLSSLGEMPPFELPEDEDDNGGEIVKD